MPPMALFMYLLQANNADAPPVAPAEDQAALAPGETEAAEGANPEAAPGGDTTVDGTAGVGNEAAAPAAAQQEKPLVQDAAETYSTAAQAIRESVGLEDAETAPIWWVGPAIALGVMVLAIFVRLAIKALLNGYLKKVVERTETDYDDKLLGALHRSVSWFIFIGAAFLAVSFLDLPSKPWDWEAIIWRVLHTLLLISIAVLAYRIVEITLHFLSEHRKEGAKSLLDEQFVPLIRDVVKFAMIILAVVMIIQAWGYSATGILTGVGIGGLALAFAAQDTVANIFGSFVVYSDRPYKVGDWIDMDGVEGTVEEIGIRSTRIRKFDKTVVSVPNKVVANTHIQNYSQMPVRRIKLYVGVTYDTPPEKIESAVEMIRGLLGREQGIDQSYWVVNFTEMADWSLNIIVYAFTTTTVWGEYLDIRQRLLLDILRGLGELGVDVAFPSQTIYYSDADAAGADDSGLPAEFAHAGGGRPRRGAPPARRLGHGGGSDAGGGSAINPAQPGSDDVVNQRGELDDTINRRGESDDAGE